MLAALSVDPIAEISSADAAPSSVMELTRVVSTSRDDAEERSNGRIQLSNSDLELVDDGSRTDRTIGVRFQNIEIPPVATIVSAEIVFTVDKVDTQATSIEISGEASGDAATFSSRKRNISSRSKTDATASWTPSAWNSIGEAGLSQTTPDLASIVDEVIKGDGWESGNSIAFLFTGSGRRTAEAYDGQASAAPQLRIVYDTPSTTASAAEPNTDPNTDPNSDPDPTPVSEPGINIVRSIAQGSDDAKENSKGRVRYSKSDLETDQLIGLRYQDIAIPKGATIIDARIQFQVDESTSGIADLRISGELAASADTYTSSRRDISSRATTGASVDWAPPNWSSVGDAGPDQRTPNLAPIIQEIVDQEDWAYGNALALTLSGLGKRVAESFEGGFSPQLTVTYAGSFAGLLMVSDIEIIRETDRPAGQRLEVKPAKDKVFDARDASFLISDSTHGIIQFKGDASQTGMHWLGGYVTGDKPWDASWDEWKNDPATRSSAVFENRAHSGTLSGMHFFNVHDGPRVAHDGFDWTVEHVWGEYIRDDAIEADHPSSGKIVDSLFDGAYSGISTRPGIGDTTADGTGEVVTLDRVLLRLKAMPYPYKYETKPGIFDENGEPWDGEGIPYGHGNLFKYDSRNVDNSVHFVIKDSVFVLPHDNVPEHQISFPPAELIDELLNVTVIWLGSGEFPGYLPTEKFPGEITVLTGKEGLDFWKEKVTDWHQRHPDVGSARKPDNPGEIVFPRTF